jgi:hypothetical protein
VSRSLSCVATLTLLCPCFGVCAGLGTEPGSCSIVSGEDNKGDGIVLCGQDPQAAMRERGWNVTAYKVRSSENGVCSEEGRCWGYLDAPLSQGRPLSR